MNSLTRLATRRRIKQSVSNGEQPAIFRWREIMTAIRLPATPFSVWENGGLYEVLILDRRSRILGVAVTRRPRAILMAMELRMQPFIDEPPERGGFLKVQPEVLMASDLGTSPIRLSSVITMATDERIPRSTEQVKVSGMCSRPAAGLKSVRFGSDQDRPVPGDYDGDGSTDIAVFRPSEGNWYLLQSRDGFAAIPWGGPCDIPLSTSYSTE